MGSMEPSQQEFTCHFGCAIQMIEAYDKHIFVVYFSIFIYQFALNHYKIMSI